MKQLWTLSTLCIVLAVIFTPQNTNASTSLINYDNSDAAIKERLCKLNSIVSGNYNDEVIAYLNGYLLNSVSDTEELLGRTKQFFPVFEHYIKIYNLPEELKYIPMIESSLRPYATSTAGACGLWQFTAQTARFQGLTINNTTDERRDTYQATRAALKYLAYLYKRFGAWDLAMAAYNCGETRLNRAITQAGSRDFSIIRNFLPTETANYVPRFLAARYLVKYYAYHGFMPSCPMEDVFNTRTIKVFKNLSFKEILKVTSIDIAMLKKLNPSYSKNVLPVSVKGNFLILPERDMDAMLTYLGRLEKAANSALEGTGSFKKAEWTVQPGDTIGKLAKLCGCSTKDIMKWNKLKSGELYYKQELVIYYPSPNIMKSRA